MAWSFSRLRIFDEQLLDVLAERVAEPEMFAQLNAPSCAILAWAYGNLAYAQPLLFDTIARAFVVGQALDFMSDRHISNVAWAFSRVKILHTKSLLFSKLSSRLLQAGPGWGGVNEKREQI